MAESSSGNWWGGWIQAAKEKSAQTLEFIKHDLSEFTAVCSQDASAVVSSTTERLQGSLQDDGGGGTASTMVKKGLTDLLGGITRVLTVPPDDDEDDTDMLRVTSKGTFEVFDKAKARLFEIQTSPQTYCTEPDGSVEHFTSWKSTFDLESRKGEISDLLVSVNEVRSIYTKLVPSAVSHSDFWERYFYKVYQLEQDELRKADLKKRADKMTVDSTEQAWEDDWDSEEPSLLERDKQTKSDTPSEPTVLLPPITTTSDVPLTTSSTTDATLIPDSDLNMTTTKTLPTTTSDVVLNDPQKGNNTISDLPVPGESSANIPTDADNDSIAGPVEEVAGTKPIEPVVGTEPVEPVVNTEPVEPAASTESADRPCTSASNTPPPSTSDQSEVEGELKSEEGKEDSNSQLQDSKVNPSDMSHNGKEVVDQSESIDLTDSVVKVEMEPVIGAMKEVAVKEKGDYLMIGSDRPTPASSVGSSGNKESSSGLDDEWDKELFGDDMKAIQELAEQIGAGKEEVTLDGDDDDWESWD